MAMGEGADRRASESSDSPISQKRPFGVTLLALAVFVLAMGNLWRVPYAIGRRDVLMPLDFPFPLAVHAALGGLWGAAWLVAAWGLWRLKEWGRRFALILTPVYHAFTLAWLAIFARSDYQRGRWPFAIGAAALIIALTLWILTRPHVRGAFEGEGDLRSGVS